MNREEVQAWLNLHERSRFAELIFEGKNGDGWSVRDYQRGSLESWASRKVHCDGRDVGKTTEIELMAMWAAVACPNREMLIAVQTENHLYPLMHRIVSRIEGTPYLKDCVVELRRSPSWHIRFKNGFVLWGRIAGPRGINFQGMHVDWQVVDEAQEMTDASWGELFQALNGGGRRWVYGVPNGLRNMFYRMTVDQGVEQYNWPSQLNPDFDEAKDAELVRLYGGMGSPGYIHRVLGRHGQPAHGVFNLDEYASCVSDSVEYVEDRLCEEDVFEAPAGIQRGAYYLGCDLGYARDPSEFVVYRAEGPYLVHVHRVHLEGVNYARQEDVIVELDHGYGFIGIGIDGGNNGRAVAHRLMSQGVDWCEKVRSIEFGSSVSMEPLPDGQIVRRPVKEFMTELLQERLGEGTLVLPKCGERESQYAGHTYSVGYGGRIVYEKGNDHIIDADRCALLRHYMDTQNDAWVDLGVRISGF